MTKFLFASAFLLGALAILWIGRIFLGADTLGLSVTILIGGVYTLGALELLQFRRATSSLNRALGSFTQPIDDLHAWLHTFDPSLQHAVRLRVEGETIALPAPVLTPYLVGLLVMLGLLGTFIGMVDTLKGAVVALEGSSELEAIRAGLAAPIEGLGLAFGTSVAGVAASAMLGLLSTLSRRERIKTSQLLDQHMIQSLRHFSGNYQQQQAFKAIQDQAQALPAVVDQLSNLAISLEAFSEKIEQGLLANQDQFHDSLKKRYRELNEAVDHSLKNTLAASAQQISDNIHPFAEKTLTQVHEATLATQQQLNQLNEQQLQAMNEAVQATHTLVHESLETSLAEQKQVTSALLENMNTVVMDANKKLHSTSQQLFDHFNTSSEQWAEQQQENATKLSATIRQELEQLRQEESERGGAAVARLSQLENVVSEHLRSLGQALEQPMAQLIETASQTPKAAAEVIEKLRGEMTKNFERDNELLSERARLMEQLDALSTTLEQNSEGQRAAIDHLVERSAQTLSKVSDQFDQQLKDESVKLSGIVEHVTSSSVEIASLSDAFSTSVTLFSESNNQLIENLTRIEASLEQSNKRSDEQLGYYVAQAREIIDHSLLSHKEIIDALHLQQSAQVAISGAR